MTFVGTENQVKQLYGEIMEDASNDPQNPKLRPLVRDIDNLRHNFTTGKNDLAELAKIIGEIFFKHDQSLYVWNIADDFIFAIQLIAVQIMSGSNNDFLHKFKLLSRNRNQNYVDKNFFMFLSSELLDSLVKLPKQDKDWQKLHTFFDIKLSGKWKDHTVKEMMLQKVEIKLSFPKVKHKYLSYVYNLADVRKKKRMQRTSSRTKGTTKQFCKHIDGW